MGEDEDGMVKGRVAPPPADPLAVTPEAAHRSEHVPAHDGGAHSLVAPANQFVVHPRLPACLAPHASPGAGQEDPVVKPRAATTQRIVRILIWPRTKPVQRDREVTYANVRHPVILVLVLGRASKKHYVSCESSSPSPSRQWVAASPDGRLHQGTWRRHLKEKPLRGRADGYRQGPLRHRSPVT
jgi:hypothetical protein